MTHYCPHCGAAQESITKPVKCIRCDKSFASAFNITAPKADTTQATSRFTHKPTPRHPSRIATPIGVKTSVSSLTRDRMDNRDRDADEDLGGEDVPDTSGDLTVDEIVASLDPSTMIRIQTEDEPIRMSQWCRGRNP